MEAPESNRDFDTLVRDEMGAVRKRLSKLDLLEAHGVDEMVAIRKRLRKLDMLEAHGVDNWEGYDEAMLELYGEDEEDE